MVFAVVCRYLHKKVATEYSGCAELGAMDAPNVSKLTAILGKHQGALMVGDTNYSSLPRTGLQLLLLLFTVKEVLTMTVEQDPRIRACHKDVT